MIQATLKSEFSKDIPLQGTFGEFRFNVGFGPDFVFVSGEDPWKDNAPDISCLPALTTLVEWKKTPKHPNGVYCLRNTYGRTSCEIHIGNYCGSKADGFYSDVEGCILLGKGTGSGQHPPLPDGTKFPFQKIVTQSTEAINEFQKAMGYQSFMLTIIRQ